MTADPLADVVSDQYRRWRYPEPIFDLPGWLKQNWQWFDPSHAHRLLWPDRAYRPMLDILIAGCGTNQAAVFAYNNPEAQVVAIDVSQASLDHQRFLQEKYSLKNLSLHLLPIEEAGGLQRDFDLIVSTGVLHHMADPQVGMNTLAACLRPDGVAAIMLYATYGRLGVEMMQSVFRELGLRQNDASLLMVKEGIDCLPDDHPLRPYLAMAPDLAFDAGLVDTFLHGRDRSYTTTECRDLLNGAGLVFQDMFIKAPYYPPLGAPGSFYQAVAALPEEKQWAIMERVNFRNGCHFFTACRPERPTARFKIDFASAAALDYVPALRYRCALNGRELSRYNWRMSLDPVQLALLQQLDGQRSLREIIAAAAATGVLPAHQPAALEQLVRNVIQALWRLDFLSIAIAPDGGVPA